MSWNTARRFWTEVAVAPAEGGFTLALDGRPVRTPAKAALVLPTAALAEAVAGEWRAQGERIAPESMPLTRAANSAVDKVTPQHAAVAAMLAGYGGTDLICYRAEGPEALAARQAAAWDPWIDWARAELGAPLSAIAGVIHQPQPEPGQRALRAHVAALDPFRLTALHDLVTLSGSLVLGLAVQRGALPAGDAWTLSRIDETWQQEQWGVDSEAEQAAEEKRAAFLLADRLNRLLEDAS